MQVSTDASLPAVWIDAGLHAREWIAPATAVYILQQVLAHRHVTCLDRVVLRLVACCDVRSRYYEFYLILMWMFSHCCVLIAVIDVRSNWRVSSSAPAFRTRP